MGTRKQKPTGTRNKSKLRLRNLGLKLNENADVFATATRKVRQGSGKPNLADTRLAGTKTERTFNKLVKRPYLPKKEREEDARAAKRGLYCRSEGSGQICWSDDEPKRSK